MSAHRRSAPVANSLARLVAPVLASLVIVACSSDATPESPVAPGAPNLARGTDEYASATFNKDLAALQRATARYHNFERAVDDGWVPITPCLSNPTLGGMGYHYGLPSRIDGVVSVEEPEVLLYEPKAGGGYRLVAVEYIIPFAILPATATPPTLLGQTFHQNTGAGLWALHAWVWKANPSGLFADWNPNVSCAAASP